MRNRHVYGKRTIAQQTLADQIFGGNSSSPLKQQQQIHAQGLLDSPSRNTRGAIARQQREFESTLIAPEDSFKCSFDEIAGGLENLTLTSAESSILVEGDAELKTPRLTPVKSAVLRSRDVNSASTRPPRRKGRKQTAAAPALESCSSATVEQESLIIVNVEPHTLNTPAAKPIISTSGGDLGSSSTKRRRRRRSRTKAVPPQQQGSSDVFSEYAGPLLSLCGDPGGRRGVGNFQEWSNSLAKYLDVTKIAEASYGEVYRLSLKSTHSKITAADESVLKIIALKPPPSVAKTSPRDAAKQAAMSEVPDVANEVRVLRHMSPVPGFTNFRDVRVVQGRLPTQFVAAWKRYNKDVKKSLFLDPSLKASYNEQQLWAVVEMQDAGTDVETLVERGRQVGIFAAWDIFWGVAGAVAKGEEWAEFEHRDLHMGNICVRPAASIAPLRPDPWTEQAEFLNPHPSSLSTARTMNYTNIETTLIDYTLSRAAISQSLLQSPGGEDPRELDADREDSERSRIAFFDLSKDDAIFAGDASEEYQYEIYRFMRSAVFLHDPAAPFPETLSTKKGKGKNPRNPSRNLHAPADAARVWRESHRLTNLVWLHFVLFKLLEAVSMRDSNGGNTVTCSGEVHVLEKDLRRRMQKLSRLLAIDKLGKGALTSAGDLVMWAIDKGWLAQEDVLGVEGLGELSELQAGIEGMSLLGSSRGGQGIRQDDESDE